MDSRPRSGTSRTRKDGSCSNEIDQEVERGVPVPNREHPPQERSTSDLPVKGRSWTVSKPKFRLQITREMLLGRRRSWWVGWGVRVWRGPGTEGWGREPSVTKEQFNSRESLWGGSSHDVYDLFSLPGFGKVPVCHSKVERSDRPQYVHYIYFGSCVKYKRSFIPCFYAVFYRISHICFV